MNSLGNFRPQMTVNAFQEMIQNKNCEENRLKASAFMALAHSTIDQLCVDLSAEQISRVRAFGAERNKLIMEFFRNLDQLSDLNDDLFSENASYRNYKKGKRVAAKNYWSLHEEMSLADFKRWEAEVPEIGAFAMKLIKKNNRAEFVEPSPLESFDFYLKEMLQDVDLKKQPSAYQEKLNALLCFCLTRVNLTEEELMLRFDRLNIMDRHGEKRKMLREQYPLAKQSVETLRVKQEAQRKDRIVSRRSQLQAQLELLASVSKETKECQDYQDYHRAKERTVALLQALALFCTEKELVSHPVLTKENQELIYNLKNKISRSQKA